MASKKTELPYPVKKWEIPEALKGYENGKLPANILRKIRGGGELWEVAAKDWNRLARAAKRDGVIVKNVSRGYRSYATQHVMFRLRYARKSTGRRPEITREWNDKTWYLRKGKSPSAVPGTSPHGWGCAQDIDHTDKRLFRWMCNNAPKHNFWLQAEKGSPFQEDWHWHWIAPKVD